MADDMVAYSGLPRDRHRMLKVLCAATDKTIGSFKEEAVNQKMGEHPGIGLVESFVGGMQQAIAQAEAPQQLKNGKNGNKK
jgi:hypothetical protein